MCEVFICILLPDLSVAMPRRNANVGNVYAYQCLTVSEYILYQSNYTENVHNMY